MAVTERFAHCATACGTHPNFTTIHRKVVIRQSRTGLFESLHIINKKENHTIWYDFLFIGGDGEIRPLRYRLWHAPDLCNHSPKGCNSAEPNRSSRISPFLSYKKQKSIHKVCFSVFGGDGEIRTLVRLPANAFRVRPVMTTSIRHHIFVNSFWNTTFFDCCETGPPRYVLLRCPKFFCSLFASQNFNRCHSLLLAASATGSARKRPHFDNSPYLY